MAFVDENPNQPGVPAPQNQQEPVSSGGAGMGGAGRAANTPGQNVPAQPSAQLSAYLNANEPQAEAFAGDISSNLSNQVSQAGAGIAPAVNTYTGNLYSVPTDTAVNAKVAQSPSSLTPEEVSTYQRQLGAAEHSPNPADTFETTSPYQNLTQGVQKAVEQANLWNSGNNIANLSTALTPFEGPSATKGNKTLDALLLSRSPGAYSQIQNAVAPAADLQGQLSQGTQQANQALQAAVQQNMATTPAAQQSAQQYVNTLNNALAQYMTQAQGDVNNYNTGLNTLNSRMSEYQPQIAALQNAVDQYNASLGQNPAGSLLSPINLPQLQLPSQTVAAPGIEQLATPQQYSEIAALLNLIGPSLMQSYNPSINPSTASQAGTYQSPVANFPSVSNVLNPMIFAASQGLDQGHQVFAQHQGNPALANDYASQLNAINAAVSGLDSSLQTNPFANSNPVPQTPTPPPPPGVGPPTGNEPASEAWWNYLNTTFPGLGGLGSSYQEYLQMLGSGGYYLL